MSIAGGAIVWAWTQVANTTVFRYQGLDRGRWSERGISRSQPCTTRSFCVHVAWGWSYALRDRGTP